MPPFVTADKTGLVNPDGSSDVSEEVRERPEGIPDNYIWDEEYQLWVEPIEE